MCESADGRMTTATRQCSGSTIGGAAAGPPCRPPRPAGGWAAPPRPPAGCAGATTGPPGAPCGEGGVNGPAGTSCAEVIVVFGSDSVFRFSQGAASASIPTSIRATALGTAHPPGTTTGVYYKCPPEAAAEARRSAGRGPCEPWDNPPVHLQADLEERRVSSHCSTSIAIGP